MKLIELKQIIDGLLERREPWQQEGMEAVVILAEPSIGALANTPIESASLGFDWDSGKLLLRTRDRIARKRKEQDAFDAGRDLLMYLATKPCKRETYETRTAKSVMKRVGYTDEDFEKYRHLFHRDKVSQ